ncbi:MAG: HD-GYP domain-containing protein, partial [Acetanaerobacterium sp.]
VNDDVSIVGSIDEELKVKAVAGIKQLYVNFKGMSDAMVIKQIDSIGTITENLIEDISENSQYMTNIIDLKMYDDYTYHHSLSVAVLSIAMGISLGFNNTWLYELGLCAMLHDIGKLDVPLEILNKPGRLTPQEYAVVKLHPLYGANYFKGKNMIPIATYDGILSHHEKYDGTGYPFGIAGRDIPDFARILIIADVYDALTSNRPYRRPNLPSEAIEYIMGGVGTFFDEKYVRVFLRKVAPYPVGTCVRLSTGIIGIVTKNHESQPLRPVVRNADDEKIVYDLLGDPDLRSVVVAGLGYN